MKTAWLKGALLVSRQGSEPLEQMWGVWYQVIHCRCTQNTARFDCRQQSLPFQVFSVLWQHGQGRDAFPASTTHPSIPEAGGKVGPELQRRAVPVAHQWQHLGEGPQHLTYETQWSWLWRWRCGRTDPEYVKAGGLAPPLAHSCKWWTSQDSTGEPTLVEDWGDLARWATLRHPNIQPICDQLEHVGEGSVLWTQGFRISKTQSSNGMSWKSPRKVPVSVVQQRPGALTSPVILCAECLHVIIYG